MHPNRHRKIQNCTTYQLCVNFTGRHFNGSVNQSSAEEQYRYDVHKQRSIISIMLLQQIAAKHAVGKTSHNPSSYQKHGSAVYVEMAVVVCML